MRSPSRILFISILCISTSFCFAQTSKGGSEASKEKARIKARYAPFALCPFKELKKDTTTMDSILAWKSFYDSLGIQLEMSKLMGYVKPDSMHKTLVLIAMGLNTPESAYAMYEELLNVDKKKIFSRKEMKIKNSDLVKSERSLSEGPGFYMIWIEGADEPDAATIGSLPDPSVPSITFNEYVVWQLYNYWSRGTFADSKSFTICSDVCKPGKKEVTYIPIASYADGVPRSYLQENGTGNLSSGGPRSVKIQAPKTKDAKAK